EVRLLISRYAEAVRVEYAVDGEAFNMLRLAYLPSGGTAFVGPMCCSPQREGFRARFWDFQIGDPARVLHAD
ncbi:DUF1349 domain-containing protein, partial [bacterium]